MPGKSRQRIHEEAIAQMEILVKPLLYSEAWKALEKVWRLELEDLYDGIARADEPLDQVRFRQGRISQLKRFFALKDRLTSTPGTGA